MSAKQISKRIKAKGLGRLKWYCQMCQKQCRDENGFKCHATSESHLRQMELFAQNPEHYLNELSNEFETGFLKLLSRRFNTTSVDANKVYNEYIQDKEHSHMNATKWETLSGFVQYLGRTGKVRVDESEVDGKLYITWIDRNPEAMARAKKKQQKVNDTLDDIAANERLMKQRLKLAQASSSGNGSSVARSTARDDTAQGVQLDAQGNLVMRLGGGEGSTSSSSSSSLSSSSSSIASRKRPIDSRPTLNFGGHGNTNKIAIESTNTNNNNNNANETMTTTSTTRATISFELPPTKRTKYDNQKGLQSGSTAPRSVMWMCEGLVVKIKNKTVGDGAYYKKKARISSCNNETLTADVRVIDSGIKIRIHQKDLETVIPKPRLDHDRSRVMLLRGEHRGMIGTLIELNVDGKQK